MAIQRILRLLGAACVVLGVMSLNARAQQDQVGKTERVQGEAFAVRNNATAALSIGDPIYNGDILGTGADARLTVTFADGQSLTLGENGEIEIDSYIYAGNQATDASVLRWASGAFLTATGAIGKANPDAVLVNTPVVTIGIRGTQFWGGRLERDFEVLVLEGRVIVSNAAGAVELNPGETTSVVSATAAPVAAAIMDEERRTRAFATVQYAE